jgi:hypothetical protein
MRLEAWRILVLRGSPPSIVLRGRASSRFRPVSSASRRSDAPAAKETAELPSNLIGVQTPIANQSGNLMIGLSAFHYDTAAIFQIGCGAAIAFCVFIGFMNREKTPAKPEFEDGPTDRDAILAALSTPAE